MNVLLADDHLLFIEGITSILTSYRPEADVSAVHTGGVVIQRALAGDCDVILLDLRLPELNGFEVLKALQKELCLVPVIVLSASENPRDIKLSSELGARAFVSKKCSAQEICSIIDRVMEGEFVFAKNGSSSTDERTDDQRWCELHGITSRQLEVLRMVQRGMSNSQIAEHLKISEATVKTHVGALFSAFSAVSRTQVVARAQMLGLD